MTIPHQDFDLSGVGDSKKRFRTNKSSSRIDELNHLNKKNSSREYVNKRTQSLPSSTSMFFHDGMAAAESFCIIAVAENRSRELGLCVFDLAAPYELLLYSVIDSISYVETVSVLELYMPVEILVLDSPRARKLTESIHTSFSRASTRVVAISRQYFDQTRGFEELKRVSANCIPQDLAKKYIVMAATACLLKYIDYIQGVHLADHSIMVKSKTSESRLALDSATISSLELLSNARTGSKKESLFGMLNSCHTSTGARLLRSTLISPGAHIPTINARLDALEAFLNSPQAFFECRDILTEFYNLDKLMGQLVMIPKVVTPSVARLGISNVISLKNTLEVLPRLSKTLEDFLDAEKESAPTLLHTIAANIKSTRFKDVVDFISSTISDSTKWSKSTIQMRHQECFAVKPSISGMLDMARQTYLDIDEKIHQLVDTYCYSLSVPVSLHYTIKYGVRCTRGYHVLVNAKFDALPSIFIQRVTTRKAVACTTRELNSLNNRLSDSLQEIYLQSNDAIQQLLEQIRVHASSLYAMTESIALLDMILSFANVVALTPPEKPYVRPHITSCGNLVIKAGRHPVIEQLSCDEPFTPNNVYVDPLVNFQVITGPNCSGKSTYLKMIAVITIMSHAGCYVPAQEAFVPLQQRIFSRIGTCDDMESNSSTFSVEMNEMAFILENVGKHSLVLVDELGRGTSNEDGLAIAWAICEKLIASPAYTLFATHYHTLCGLSTLYPNVRNNHLSVANRLDKILFGYKLEDGPTRLQSGYGIQMAKICGLPSDIVNFAEQLTHSLLLNSSTENDFDCHAVNYELLKRKKTLHRILSLRYTSLDVTGKMCILP